MGCTPITLSLDSERDRDILDWLNRIPARQRSIRMRKALRDSIRTEVSLADVYQAICEVKRLVSQGEHARVQGSGGQAGPGGPGDDPQVDQARRAIADLGL